MNILLRGFDFWVPRLKVDEEELKFGARLLWLMGLSMVGDGFGVSGLDVLRLREVFVLCFQITIFSF